MRSRLLMRYILSEMIPSFFLGVAVFVFILLTFQALRLTEFVLIHGVKVSVILEMMMYMSASFLPILFPMSLLFTVIMTYTRMSADSEVVAARAVGLSTGSLILPAIIFSLLVTALSLQTAFEIAPWGNRQFEILITQTGAMKPAAVLREGTFSDGFFDLVVYANKVDSKNGHLQGVFIYDERKPDEALTIIAREGSVIQDPEHPGQSASLRLTDGSVHRALKEGRHTKIDFSAFDFKLSTPVGNQSTGKSPQSMNYAELKTTMNDPKSNKDFRREVSTDYHRRWAMAFLCILFALVGVGLGTKANRRAARGGSMAVCLGLIVFYWVLYATFDGFARSGQLPPAIAMWSPNFIYMIIAFFTVRRAWT